jgi:hypothetical protein
VLVDFLLAFLLAFLLDFLGFVLDIFLDSSEFIDIDALFVEVFILEPSDEELEDED